MRRLEQYIDRAGTLLRFEEGRRYFLSALSGVLRAAGAHDPADPADTSRAVRRAVALTLRQDLERYVSELDTELRDRSIDRELRQVLQRDLTETALLARGLGEEAQSLGESDADGRTGPVEHERTLPTRGGA